MSIEQDVQPADVETESLDGSTGAEEVDSGEELASDVPGESSQEITEEAKPEYTPDYSYRVKDEQFEFDEAIRAAVTSKEAEDLLRDLYTKSRGLDEYKGKVEDFQSKLSEVSSEKQTIMSNLDRLQHFMDNDLGTFFNELGLPQQKIVDYVASILKESDLPAEERAAIEQRRQSVAQGWEQQQHLSTLEQQNQELKAATFNAEYERTLSMPEVKKFQQAFDEKLGAGEFKRHADLIGVAHYHEKGTDTTPLAAVQQVMEKYQKMINLSPESDLVSAKAALEDGRPEGVIPNVGKKGRTSASPVKKRPKSLAELKKILNQQLGEEGNQHGNDYVMTRS